MEPVVAGSVDLDVRWTDGRRDEGGETVSMVYSAACLWDQCDYGICVFGVAGWRDWQHFCTPASQPFALARQRHLACGALSGVRFVAVFAWLRCGVLAASLCAVSATDLYQSLSDVTAQRRSFTDGIIEDEATDAPALADADARFCASEIFAWKSSTGERRSAWTIAERRGAGAGCG